ncbi:MAG: hypothetical protein J6A52_02630 [Bacilli bacterium]|nr:hypothetical protein [Bacilli bacterium]
MGAQQQSWIIDILRSIFSALDSMVYGLINWILYGIFDLANLTTSSDVLNGIYSRIYVILGVFMAFKLCFSFFGYILDPDSMVGKSDKSVPKLLMSAGVMLAALVILPTILFNNGEGRGLINRAQNAFLPMLPRILLGVNENSGLTVGNPNNSNSIDDAANVMALSTLQAFFIPPEELDDICGTGTLEKTPAITSIGDFTSNVNLTCNAKGTGIVGIGATKYYLYSYLWGVSTIVGILMVVMLLGISIDIAKRVFKMIILQIVAPIPIMTLIDPKSKTKDGTFGKWLSMLISTFLDIFIKLGILYVVLMMIQLIVSKGLFTNFPEFTEQPLRAAYLIVFLILGLIFFAKEAPKFIKDSLGIKDSGAGMGTGFGAAAGALGGLIAGRGLSGAVTGAVAGATADPKVGGYAAGRDKAGQLRTGDKNWKGGFANTLGRWNLNRTANRLGLSEANVNAADKYASSLESIAENAEREYQEALHSGVTGNALAQLRTNADNATSAAKEARKNADKGKKAREAMGVTGRTSIQDMYANRRRHSAVRRGVGRVIYGSTDAFDQEVSDRDKIRDARRELHTAERTDNNAHRGIYDPYKGTNHQQVVNDKQQSLNAAINARDQHRQNRQNNNNNNNNNP